jgi:ABC-type phosphate/phosphonate transport system substrate-binding protein
MAGNNLNRLARWFLLLELVVFSGLANATDLFAEPTFRAGFYTRAFPDFSAEDLKISVKLLSEEIGKNVGIQTTVTVFDDIALMRNAFEQGKINFVVASSLNLTNDFDNNLLADGFRLVITNGYADSMAILTRKNEGLDNFNALRGKKIGLVEFDPLADLYIDFLTQSVFKKDYKASFNGIKREKKASQVILKLFFGQTDAICVYQNAYRLAAELNPQLLTKLQVISQLNDVPQGAGLFHKNVPPAFREQVITEAFKLDTNVRGQQLLQLFKSDKIIRASFTDLSAAKKLYIDYQQLKNNR